MSDVSMFSSVIASTPVSPCVDVQLACHASKPFRREMTRIVSLLPLVLSKEPIRNIWEE